MLNYSAKDINYNLAYDAHRGTSFTPEKRAEQVIQDYLSDMAALVEEFNKLVTSENEAELTADLEQYRQGYVKRLHAKLSADSRCMSSMITGPANFPVRRNQKRLDTAHKRLEEFLDFDKRAIDRLRKKYDPRFQSQAISSDDDQAIEKLQAKIDQAEKRQEFMKAVNKIVKSKKADPDKIAELAKLEVSEATARKMLDEGFTFEHFELTNNNANIRRMKERVAGLELEHKRQQARQESGKGERTVNGIKIIENTDINRIQLFFPGKPSAEIRDRLKHNGFHWSPREVAWQRQLNEASQRVVESLVKNLNPN